MGTDERRELKFPDLNFAVFNLHVNDAGKKALALCRKKYGGTPGLKQLEKHYRSGIMAIFNEKPTRVSMRFAELCFQFTNELTDSEVKKIKRQAKESVDGNR